jgi:predicted MPP superfamily phosphohydrolase
MMNAQQLLSYIDLINRQTFDVILIGGDFIDGNEKSYVNRGYDLIFSQLKPKYGVYAVAGNHEYYDNFNASQTFVKSLNFHFLRDEISCISDSSILLVGRDDRTNSQRQSIEELLAHIDSSKYVIVIDHQPSELERIANTSADLVLCGHTHNGQVFPLTTMIRWMWKVAYGQAKIGNTDIYVSSGLGLWGMPYRIGSDSELVVIRIKE